MTELRQYGKWRDLGRVFASPRAEARAGLDGYLHRKDIKLVTEMWVKLMNEQLEPLGVVIDMDGYIMGPLPVPPDWADMVAAIVARTNYKMGR